MPRNINKTPVKPVSFAFLCYNGFILIHLTPFLGMYFFFYIICKFYDSPISGKDGLNCNLFLMSSFRPSLNPTLLLLSQQACRKQNPVFIIPLTAVVERRKVDGISTDFCTVTRSFENAVENQAKSSIAFGTKPTAV